MDEINKSDLPDSDKAEELAKLKKRYDLKIQSMAAELEDIEKQRSQKIESQSVLEQSVGIKHTKKNRQG